jgi:hypothetical protein
MKKNTAVLTGLIFLIIFSTGELFSGSGKQVVKWISATTSLKGKNMRYGAGNLLDKSSGSWCEGVKGDGIGEKITLKFWKEEILRTLYFINGLKSKKYYSKNNRVKVLKINGESYTLRDSPLLQKIVLNKPVKAKKLVLEIVSVYPGSKWKDTCITEISVNAPVKVSDDYGDDLMGSITGIDWRPPDGLFDKYGSTIIYFNRALMFSEDAVPCGDESCPITSTGYCNKISKGKYRCAHVENCYGMMKGSMQNPEIIRVCKDVKREFMLRILKGKPEVEFGGNRKFLIKD